MHSPGMLGVIAAMLATLALTSLPARAAAPGIVVANSGGKGTTQFQSWQEFRKNVDDNSGGTLLLDYLIYGELGSAQSTLQAVIDGRATVGGIGCAGITQIVPELAVPQMPYLFSSQEEVDFVFNRYLTPIFSEILAAHNLVLLQWTEMGWMDVYSRLPVQLPNQLENQQIRTPNNIVGPTFLRAVKATPSDVGVGDLSTSSAQADKLFGGFGPIRTYARLHTIFKYMTETRHSYNCGIVVANKTWFDSASPKEQDVLRAAYPTMHELAPDNQDETKALRADLITQGAAIMTLTPEQHNAWAAAALPLYPSILEQARGRSIEVYDLIRAGKQAFLREPVPKARH